MPVWTRSPAEPHRSHKGRGLFVILPIFRLWSDGSTCVFYNAAASFQRQDENITHREALRASTVWSATFGRYHALIRNTVGFIATSVGVHGVYNKIEKEAK